MNELKFRAWDKKDKVIRIVYGILFKRISNKGNRENTIVELHCSDYEKSKAILFSSFNRLIEDVIIMQYTGLKDMNDKEIYEGDVLGVTINGEKLNWIIQWDDRGYWDRPEWNGNSRIHKYKIIGNIYENPELL